MFKTFRARGLAAVVLSFAMTSCFSGSALSPEETVQGYLTAFQSGDFEKAYSFVSKGMARDKTKEEWATEQRNMVLKAEAQIIEFTIYPGVTGEESASVPNVLRAKDKLFNQTGALEYEVYELIFTEEKWAIDHSRLLIGKEAIAEVFPADVAESAQE
jgi:hypothetical protein